MQKQNFSQGGFMPQNRQHHRKAKYPDKVAKPKSLVFVRIFLFRSAGSKITYFPTAPFLCTEWIFDTDRLLNICLKNYIIFETNIWRWFYEI